jgi:co-chaperonin GroES (HSP10)
MKLRAIGHRILVRPDGLEEEELLDKKHEELKKKGFVINKPEGQHRREAQGTDVGEIVDIGPMAWKHSDYGYPSAEWQPWAKIGDRIVFGRYTGKLKEDPETGIEYMIINDDDVQLVEDK